MADVVGGHDDLDLDFCARTFELAGGSIRNIGVAAAYLAADAGRSVGMREVVVAIQRELQKMGRLRNPSVFGPYEALVSR